MLFPFKTKSNLYLKNILELLLGFIKYATH